MANGGEHVLLGGALPGEEEMRREHEAEKAAKPSAFLSPHGSPRSAGASTCQPLRRRGRRSGIDGASDQERHEESERETLELCLLQDT